MSEGNVKTNKMESTKRSYHDIITEFATNYLFLKILFQFKNLLGRVDLMYQLPNCSYSKNLNVLEFYFRELFL